MIQMEIEIFLLIVAQMEMIQEIMVVWDNDNDNNIGLPEGSNIADTLDKRLTVMLNQYYGDFKNIYTFIDWYKDQCKYMNKTTDANYNCDWWFNNSEGSIIILNKHI